MINETDLAYAAGIVDGEGCISLENASPKATAHNKVVCCTVVNTNPKLLIWFREKFGGVVSERRHTTPNRKRFYQWRLRGRKAVAFLEIIMPFLLIKREQAEIVIAFQKTKGRQGVRVPQEIVDARGAMSKRIHELNRRGVIAAVA